MNETPSSPAPQDQPANKKAGIPVQRKLMAGLIVFAILSAVGGFIYWLDASKYVYTDKAGISAPLIQLASQGPGILKYASVREGDRLSAYETVARVGDELIQTQVGGIAVTVQEDIGAAYRAGQAVVTMIQPQELRVVAQIEEDKGLKDIYVGQKVIFTVDAYGSQKFQGTIESISATSHQQDVVFNISDQREQNNFDVKIKYSVADNPDFQNGMSARVWIVK